MAGVSKAVSDELYIRTEKALRIASTAGEVSRKLQAIKSSKNNDIKKVAEVFGVSRVTIMAWIRAFENEGIEGLQIKSGRGRKSFITETEEKIIRKWILKDNNITIKEINVKIEKTFGKKVCMSTTHNLVRKIRLLHENPDINCYKTILFLYRILKR